MIGNIPPEEKKANAKIEMQMTPTKSKKKVCFEPNEKEKRQERIKKNK